MSQFYDQASLVMVPSGYKDGKLYSQKPLSTSGELSFSRGSDIEATRVNANGYIEKAQVNLSKNSQTVASWGTAGVTVDSTSEADPFGGTAAGRFSAVGGASSYLFSDSAISYSSGSVYSGSYYVKDVDASYVQLTFATNPFGTGQYQNFDLTTGTKGTGAGLIDSTIEAVSGYAGWYRISITALCSTSATGAIVIVIVPSASATRLQASTAGQTIDATGGQVNYGLVAQTYQETTTAAVVSGITDNMPRLNYDPANPTCPSLLLEPSRTNHYYKSEYFSTGSRVVFTQNAVTSPEGVSNGTSVVATSALGSHEVTLSPLISIGNTNPRTFSVYAKYNGNHLILNVAGSSSSWTACIFDLENGVAKTPQNNGSQTACTADIEDAGNGWYRCSITYTPYASGGFYHLISLTDDVNATLTTWGADNYTGDDVNGIYIYGAQVEEGSYPTSYIPTYGSSATRTADACSKTGISSLIGQTEGTIFLDFVWNGLGTSSVDNAMLSLGLQEYGTSNIAISNYNGALYGRVTVGTVIEATIPFGSMTAGTRYKAALAYANNNVIFYVNGSSYGSDTSASIPATSSVRLQNAYPNAKKVNQALLFKTRLSNADLATLTTL